MQANNLVLISSKKCTKCGRTKSSVEFYCDDRAKSKLHSRCKVCINKDFRGKYKSNSGYRQVRLEYAKEYQKQHRVRFIRPKIKGWWCFEKKTENH